MNNTQLYWFCTYSKNNGCTTRHTSINLRMDHLIQDSGGAQGDDLRYLAIEGKDKELRERLKGIANTASCDDLGLSPLMYAVRIYELSLTVLTLLYVILIHRFGMDM